MLKSGTALRPADDNGGVSLPTEEDPKRFTYYVSQSLYNAFTSGAGTIRDYSQLERYCVRKCDEHFVSILPTMIPEIMQIVYKRLKIIQFPMTIRDLSSEMYTDDPDVMDQHFEKLRYIAEIENNAVDLSFINAIIESRHDLDKFLDRYNRPSSQEYYMFFSALKPHVGNNCKPYISHPIAVASFDALAPYIDERAYDMVMAARSHFTWNINYDGLLNDTSDPIYMPFLTFCTSLHTATRVYGNLEARGNASSVRIYKANADVWCWFNHIQLNVQKSKYYSSRGR